MRVCTGQRWPNDGFLRLMTERMEPGDRARLRCGGGKTTTFGFPTTEVGGPPANGSVKELPAVSRSQAKSTWADLLPISNSGFLQPNLLDRKSAACCPICSDPYGELHQSLSCLFERQILQSRVSRRISKSSFCRRDSPAKSSVELLFVRLANGRGKRRSGEFMKCSPPGGVRNFFFERRGPRGVACNVCCSLPRARPPCNTWKIEMD